MFFPMKNDWNYAVIMGCFIIIVPVRNEWNK